MNKGKDDIDATLDNLVNLYTKDEVQRKQISNEFARLTLERFSNLILESLNPEEENTKKLLLYIEKLTKIDANNVKTLSEKMSNAVPPQTLLNLFLVSKLSALLDSVEILAETASEEEKKSIAAVLKSNPRITKVLQI